MFDTIKKLEISRLVKGSVSLILAFALLFNHDSVVTTICVSLVCCLALFIGVSRIFAILASASRFGASLLEILYSVALVVICLAVVFSNFGGIMISLILGIVILIYAVIELSLAWKLASHRAKTEAAETPQAPESPIRHEPDDDNFRVSNDLSDVKEADFNKE